MLAGQRENGRTFVNLFTDSIGGGGARSYRDGIDTCGNLVSPNYGIPNAERIESLFPLLYVYRRQTAETAGAGQYRGGVGLEYMVIPYGAKGDGRGDVLLQRRRTPGAEGRERRFTRFGAGQYGAT